MSKAFSVDMIILTRIMEITMVSYLGMQEVPVLVLMVFQAQKSTDFVGPEYSH